jgi:hypothetical protein
MTAQFRWKRRRLRGIEKGARDVADPLERLRYVRDQMELEVPPRECGGWRLKTVAAMVEAATGAVQLMRGYIRRNGNEQR